MLLLQKQYDTQTLTPKITETPTIYWNDATNVLPRLTAALTIKWSKFTAARIRG